MSRGFHFRKGILPVFSGLLAIDEPGNRVALAFVVLRILKDEVRIRTETDSKLAQELIELELALKSFSRQR